MTSSHLPAQVGFQVPAAKTFPAIVLIAVSSPCNLKCPACPCTQLASIRDTKGPDGRQQNYFTFDDYVRVADECAAHAQDGFTPRLRLSGYGEPLMNRDLLAMIRYSCSVNVPTSLITNGQLLRGDLAGNLLETGIESIEISVDAHEPELYRQIRTGGDFQRLVANISALVAARDALPPDRRPLILASVVRSPLSAPHIDDITRFWRDVGVDRVSVRKFLTWGVDELRDMQKRLGEEAYLASEAPCPYPFERIMIDPAGWIRLCPYDDQKLIPDFGHIATTRLADVWRGLRMGSIRACHGASFDGQAAERDAPLCAHCEDRLNRSWTHNYLSIAQQRT